MTPEEIVQKINEVFAEEFEIDSSAITLDAPVIETLQLDSLDMIDVVVLVDKNLGVTLVEKDFQGIKTFQNFYDLIIAKCKEAAAAKK